VYEGLYFLAVRDFKKAADLFLDSTATFTATELFSYKTFIFYTVLTSLITLKRVDLKAKVRLATCALYFSCSRSDAGLYADGGTLKRECCPSGLLISSETSTNGGQYILKRSSCWSIVRG
jgi:hypothetical protein